MRVSSRCALSALVLMVTLSACGGDEEPTEPVAAAALALTPGDQALTMGGAPVAFTASGGSGSYAWTLSPATGAGTLSAASGERVEYTPPASVTGAVVATLTVTSGDERAVAVLRVEPRTVQGRVLTLQGDPLPGLMVALAGPGGTFTTASTDAEGRFSFANVPATYDLVLVEAAQHTATLFQGLTRADPILSAYGGTSASATTVRSATVSGTVSGGGATPPPSGTTYVTSLSFAAASPFFMGFPMTTADSTSGAYTLNASWTGEPATTGTLYALQVHKDAAGNPTAYPGYAMLEGVALTKGDTVSGKNLTLAPVPSTPFTATLSFPAGTTGSSRYLYLQHAPNAVSTLVSGGSGSTFALAAPNLPGAALMTLLNFTTPNGTGQVIQAGIPLNASNLTIDMPDVPVRQTPVDAATGVAVGTRFSWSPLAGAVHFVLVNGSGTSPDLNVVTSNAQFTLPDLSALGISLPRGTAYTWNMYTLGGLGSVDALAVLGGYYRAMYAPVGTLAPSRSVYLSPNTNFSFTTAP